MITSLMHNKIKLYFNKKQVVNLEFSNEEISSDGGFVLLEKIERKSHLIRKFSNSIPDVRHSSYTKHKIEDMVKQRVFLLCQGYEDCNDEKYLRNDPLLNEINGNKTVSQPTLSRFENSINRRTITELSKYFVDTYIKSIPTKKKQITIDVDSTDSETYGNQQFGMFNGFYAKRMYHPLLFHDGDTGQLILPVLRAGNVHTSEGFVKILDMMLDKIRAKRPNLKIIIRGDSGFGGSEFYRLVEKYDLHFCVGLRANPVLDSKIKIEKECINNWFYKENQEYKYFTDKIEYQAQSWDRPQNVYARIESTKQGFNRRYFCSNLYGKTAKELYLDFYVKRCDRSENRIKELKCMCYSDRLSCHEFHANYFRLMLSSLSYEIFRLIREGIIKTGNQTAAGWQVTNIRLYLLKVGATLIRRVRTLTVKFSKSYVCKELLTTMLC